MKRELIPTVIRTEFGEVLDSPEFYESTGADQDHTYVPGYSDMRRARDLAIGQAMRNRRIEIDPETGAQSIGSPDFKDVPTLPVRLQWARTSKIISGAPDNTKEVAFGSQGYRLVTKADIGQAWLTAMPQGATEQADGSIKKGDTTLMVVDAKTAARNAALNQLAIRKQTKDRVEAPFVRQGKPGQTWVESEPADHQIAAPPPRMKKS